MLICALLNIVFSIALGKLMGLSGILFASALSKLCTYIWYEPILLFKSFFKMSPLVLFRDFTFITAVTAIICVLFNYFYGYIQIDGIIGFVIKGVLYFSVSNVIYLLLYCRSPYLKKFIQRVKGLVLSVLSKK